MHRSEVSSNKLQLGDVSQNGRGGKTASLSVNGKPLRLTLRNCTTPFEVSSYDRVSDRKSLDLRADDETAAFRNRLDTDLKKYAGKVGCAESGYTALLKSNSRRRASHGCSATKSPLCPLARVHASSLRPGVSGG